MINCHFCLLISFFKQNRKQVNEAYRAPPNSHRYPHISAHQKCRYHTFVRSTFVQATLLGCAIKLKIEKSLSFSIRKWKYFVSPCYELGRSCRIIWWQTSRAVLNFFLTVPHNSFTWNLAAHEDVEKKSCRWSLYSTKVFSESQVINMMSTPALRNENKCSWFEDVWHTTHFAHVSLLSFELKHSNCSTYCGRISPNLCKLAATWLRNSDLDQGDYTRNHKNSCRELRQT